MKEEILIRTITADDIHDITRLRCAMFESMGYEDPEQLAEVALACQTYFARAIPARQYHGWLAFTTAGVAVASGGVVVDEHPPGPMSQSGRVGYIMNLYTDPAFRRRGLARQLFERIMDWIRTQGISVAALHATPMGQALYAQYGFADSNEMRAGI